MHGSLGEGVSLGVAKNSESRYSHLQPLIFACGATGFALLGILDGDTASRRRTLYRKMAVASYILGRSLTFRIICRKAEIAFLVAFGGGARCTVESFTANEN